MIKVNPQNLIGKLTLSSYEQKLESTAKELETSPEKVHDIIFNIGLGINITENSEKFAKVMDSSIADITYAASIPGLVPPWLFKQASLGIHRGFYQKWIRSIRKGKATSVDFHKILAKLDKFQFPFAEEKGILRQALESEEIKLKFDRLLKLRDPVEKEKELRNMFFHEGNDPKVPLGDNYHASVGWY